MARRIGAWLAAWAGAVVARPRLTAAVTLGLAALAAWYAAQNLGVNTDTANMIAPTIPWRQHYNEYRDAFPVRDRNLLIVVEAPTPARADEYASALMRELRAQPERYRSPLLAGEGEFFERNGLLYMPTAQLAALTDRLAAAQPLLGLLGEKVDGTAVLDVARRTLTADVEGDTTLTSFYEELARTIAGAGLGDDSPLAWNELISSEPPRKPATPARRIITLQPALDFSRMQPAAAAIADLREIAARLDAEGDVDVRLTGTVAMEHEELLSVSRGAGLGAFATFVMVALVLYAALRSWRLLFAAIVTLVVGLSLTAAFAAVAVGHLNLLSIAFVVLNVGLGSDYVIHVLLRYRELVAAGQSTSSALVEAVRGVGSSLVLCAVTTAAGFYAFIPTTFSGVSELGLIAGTGVFFGLFASVTMLPALVAWWDEAPRRSGSAPTWLDPRIFAPLSRFPRLVLGATTIALGAAFAALPFVTFDSNPIHLRDPDSESVRTLLELAAAGEAPLLNLVAVAPDAATARSWAARLRERGDVRAVTTADALVPAEQEEKLALLDDLALLMGSDFGEIERTPADTQALRAALRALEAASAGEAAAPLHDAIEAFGARLAAAGEGERDATLRRLDGTLTEGLPRELARLAAALQAQRFERDDLPEPLARRWLASGGRELVEITPAEDVSDNAAARRFIAAVHSVVPTATGLPVVYQEASATVVAAFERALLYAFVMVAAIIWLVLRDVKDTLLVLVPIALASVLTAALTVAVGMPFNYANIIALPLLVGIGVDNGIHVVHRMRTRAGMPEVGQRREQLPGDSVERLFDTSTMRAVLASGLTTVASFGNLAFSAHRGTSSMGILLALGLAASMAATLIVLPAWLAARPQRKSVAA
jgi:hopanoid biosynthesis associated RND transporter like protein HpnN